MAVRISGIAFDCEDIYIGADVDEDGVRERVFYNVATAEPCDCDSVSWKTARAVCEYLEEHYAEDMRDAIRRFTEKANAELEGVEIELEV